MIINQISMFCTPHLSWTWISECRSWMPSSELFQIQSVVWGEVVADPDNVAGTELLELLEQDLDVGVDVQVHVHEDQLVEVWEDPVDQWANIEQFVKILADIKQLKRMHCCDDLLGPIIIGNTIQVNIINNDFGHFPYIFTT